MEFCNHLCEFWYRSLQNLYNSYTGQHYVQVYGYPGAVNTAVYPLDQFGQPLPAGPGYTAVQGYTLPAHPVGQLGGQNVNGMLVGPRSMIQSPYPPGIFSSQRFPPPFLYPFFFVRQQGYCPKKTERKAACYMDWLLPHWLGRLHYGLFMPKHNLDLAIILSQCMSNWSI